jgi:hypothetical protein
LRSLNEIGWSGGMTISYLESTSTRAWWKTLRQCISLIVVSSNSVRSEWVRKETEIALKNGHVIPILKESVQLPDALSELHRNLSERHCCNLVDWDRKAETEAIGKLLQDIRLIISTQTSPPANVILRAALAAQPPRKVHNRARLALFAGFGVLPVIVLVGLAILSSHFTASTPSSAGNQISDSGSRRSDEKQFVYPTPTSIPKSADLSSLIDSWFPSESGIHSGVWQLVEQNQLEQARQLLEIMTDRTEADGILLSKMQLDGIGGAVEDGTAILRRLKSPAAKFSLGMFKAFGGEPGRNSVLEGLQLIEGAMERGFSPEDASMFFHEGCCIKAVRDFPTVMKRLHLEAANGNFTARALKGIMKLHGYSIPPCLPTGCIGEAQDIARELRDEKQTNFADLIDHAAKRVPTYSAYYELLRLAGRKNSPSLGDNKPSSLGLGHKDAPLSDILKEAAEEEQRSHFRFNEFFEKIGKFVGRFDRP